MSDKKIPTSCEGRDLKAKTKNLPALNSAFAHELQSVPVDILRARRLARAGLSLALASTVATIAFGEVRR